MPIIQTNSVQFGVTQFTNTIGNKVIKEISGKYSIINYLQVLFGSIWGVLFFSEIININFLLGASLVLLGTIISSTKIRKRI